MTFVKGEEIQVLNDSTILIGQKVDYALMMISKELPANSDSFITAEFVNDMYKMFFHWYGYF